MKKVLLLLVIIMQIAVSAAQAGTTGFSDVDSGHWAYAQIKRVVDAGVLSKHNDGRFDPDGTVSRAEFAQVLVKALGIDNRSTGTVTFLDTKNHRAKHDIEAAKYYLTGYKTSAGYTFKPDLPSVREDMAVALVKAAGMQDKQYNPATLESFADKHAISSSLIKFVCIAVEQGIMVGGTGTDGKTYFRPQSDLTRAETASLITRVAKLPEDDEKVTFEEEKVVLPAPAGKTAVLEAKATNSGLQLNWSAVSADGFVYYKIVLSTKDSSPSYPDDGSLACITDRTATSYLVKSYSSYSGGDFGGKTKPGHTYYVSVTAVYKDGKHTSNVVKLTMP